ncbi:TPA: peptidase M4 family protein [Staphylococcus aureus]|nr:peptidase M4 family protein [Staphylococcus aureus]
MRKFSRYAFTSMAALTLLSTLSPAALAIDSKNKPANSDIKFEVTQKSDAVKALKELPKSENVKNIYQDYAVTDVKTDKKGFTHYTLQPSVDGVHAPDKEVKVHADKSGKVVLINGDTDAKKVKPTNKVTLSKDDAADKAFKAVKIDKNKAKNLKDKVIKENKVEIDGDSNKYVYNVELITVTPEISHWKVKIDAQTGEILEKMNLVKEAAETGKGKGVLGDTKDININSIDEDFLMGEDVYTPGKEGDALRSMSNPEQFGQPAHMKDYVFTEKDNGGVHTNSGIPNKAAYNVIQAIGKSKSEQIYYRALTEYLTSNSNFKDCKDALYQAAKDLYDEQTAEQVYEAWNEVGVE